MVDLLSTVFRTRKQIVKLLTNTLRELLARESCNRMNF